MLEKVEPLRSFSLEMAETSSATVILEHLASSLGLDWPGGFAALPRMVTGGRCGRRWSLFYRPDLTFMIVGKTQSYWSFLIGQAWLLLGLCPCSLNFS